MRNITLILTVLFFVSCSQVEKKESKSETLNPQTEKSEVKPAQTETVPTVDKEEVKKCLCPKPFNTTKTQIKISYGERFLKFCAWDYDTVSNRTYEFRIYTDKDSILLNGDIPTVFEFENFNSPLSFVQYSKFPKEIYSRWEYTPIFEYSVVLADNEFEIEKKFKLNPPKVSESFQDSVLMVFKNQPEHHGSWDKSNPPFTSEKYIMELFICAVNGNTDCVEAYDSLRTRFVTDGAIGELYLELNGLLQTYKEIKNY